MNSESPAQEHCEVLLRDVYTFEGARQWLYGYNRILKEVPIVLLEEGESQRVLDAIEMLRSGAYV